MEMPDFNSSVLAATCKGLPIKAYRQRTNWFCVTRNNAPSLELYFVGTDCMIRFFVLTPYLNDILCAHEQCKCIRTLQWHFFQSIVALAHFGSSTIEWGK